MKRLGLVAAFLLWCMSLSAPAEACSCVLPPAPCEAAWQAGAVFVGRVDSVTPVPGNRMPPARRVRLTIVEMFTGPAGPQIEIDTGGGGGDCGYRFRQGSEYLVYAFTNSKTGRLQASICSRTRLASAAAEDLAYLRSAFRDRTPVGRISGTVMLRQRNLARRLDDRKPAPSIPIIIQPAGGGPEVRVVTDRTGRFSTDGFAAGSYTLRYELPETHYGEFMPRVLELRDPRACVSATGLVAHDGRIGGRIVDAAGVPLAGLTVDVTVRSGLHTEQGAERIQAVTAPDGRYEVARLPAGTFIVGINTQPLDGEGVPPRLFHPGVEGVGDATGVRLAGGERTTIADFVVPPRFRPVRIEGIVLDSDGAPSPGALVHLAVGGERDHLLGMPVTTDATGRFILTAFEGLRYRIFAERTVSSRREWSDPSEITAAPSLLPITLRLRLRY